MQKSKQQYSDSAGGLEPTPMDKGGLLQYRDFTSRLEHEVWRSLFKNNVQNHAMEWVLGLQWLPPPSQNLDVNHNGTTAPDVATALNGMASLRTLPPTTINFQIRVWGQKHRTRKAPVNHHYFCIPSKFILMKVK